MGWYREFDQGGIERRERRLTPLVLLLGTILYACNGLRSLKDAFSDVLAYLNPEEPPEAISKGSISDARKRLPLELLAQAKAHVLDVCAQVPRPALLAGLEVWCIDGTIFATADTEENMQYYGKPSASRGQTGFPRMRSVLAMEAATHLFIQEVHDSQKISENALIDRLIPQVLRPGVLLEADRGFLSFERAAEVLELGGEFLGVQFFSVHGIRPGRRWGVAEVGSAAGVEGCLRQRIRRGDVGGQSRGTAASGR